MRDLKKAMLHARSFAPSNGGKGTSAKDGTRRKRAPNITKKKLRKAIKGSLGIIGTIRDRCGVAADLSIQQCLAKWPEFQTLLDQERDAVLDIAEKALHHWAEQRKDGKLSAQTSQYLLDRLGGGRGFKKKSEVTIEGGATPLQMGQVVDIDSLNLPLSERKRLLREIERPSIKKKKIRIRRIQG